MEEHKEQQFQLKRAIITSEAAYAVISSVAWQSSFKKLISKRISRFARNTA
jgi:hypothetical protein